MEVSALKHAGVAGLHGRSPLLRLQSDERLIALVRRGNHGAFEVLVSRYQARLLAFCRHMLGSREDAEDVLQEVFAAAFNAILADDRPINARPWLYRIARNRSLNHLRRAQPIGVDSMDVHYAEHGASTADKVHKREEFRELIADVQGLPETQRTALLLREIDALSYEQIAEAMETTIPSVKSLLVRARVSLAEAAEARQLSCDDVRLELGEIAEGLKRRATAPARRHLRTCAGCAGFRQQLRSTNKALAAVMPVGFALAVRKIVLAHLGISAGAGSGASATGAAGAAAGSAVAGGATGGLLSAGMSTVATKAAAGLAAAALVTAGAVEIEHRVPRDPKPQAVVAEAPASVRAEPPHQSAPSDVQRALAPPARAHADKRAAADARAAQADATADAVERPAVPAETTTTTGTTTAAAPPPPTTTMTTPAAPPPTTATAPAPPPGQTQVESGTTALPSELPTQQPPQTLAPSQQPAAATPQPATTAPPSTLPAQPVDPAVPAEQTPVPADPPAATTPAPPPAAPAPDAPQP